MRHPMSVPQPALIAAIQRQQKEYKQRKVRGAMLAAHVASGSGMRHGAATRKAGTVALQCTTGIDMLRARNGEMPLRYVAIKIVRAAQCAATARAAARQTARGAARAAGATPAVARRQFMARTARGEVRVISGQQQQWR